MNAAAEAAEERSKWGWEETQEEEGATAVYKAFDLLPQERRDRRGSDGGREDDISSAIDGLLSLPNANLQKADFDSGVRRYLGALRGCPNGPQKVKDAMAMLHTYTSQKSRSAVKNWPAYLLTLLKRFEPGALNARRYFEGKGGPRREDAKGKGEQDGEEEGPQPLPEEAKAPEAAAEEAAAVPTAEASRTHVMSQEHSIGTLVLFVAMVLEGIKYELRQTFYEFLTLKADWRRISRRVAPVAAFVTLGAGVLYARKRQNPPDSGFLASCTFTCGSSSSALLKEVRSQAPDFAALQRAARRWRGPMERDLMRVQLGRESTVAVVQRLVAEWQEAGYFAEPLTVKRPREAFPGIDLISQVDESYGRDIGSEVPLCLLEDGHAVRSLSPEDWMAASDSLEVHGAVVLRELISTEQVMRLRERMHLQSSQLDLAKCKGGVPPIREFNSKPLQAEDEDLEPHMSTPGRKHFYLRGRIFEQQVAEAQADPCAVDQFWHVDNAASGLTLVVPLTAIPGDMGGTLLLPGSHHLFSNQGTVSRVQNFFSSLLSANGQPSVMLNAGDAFLYDSRLLHRSAANRRYDRTAAVLVFRYDFERPPGMGLIAAQIWSWTGNLLSGLHRFYSRLPPPP
eukprot:g25768.t1